MGHAKILVDIYTKWMLFLQYVFTLPEGNANVISSEEVLIYPNKNESFLTKQFNNLVTQSF